VVRERTVELRVQQVELERQALEHLGDDQPPHPVGGVGHDLQGTQGAHVDERPHVPCEVVQEVEGLDAPRLCGRRGHPGGHQPLDLGQAGVLADRPGAREAELDAVVLGRVVRRREHRPRGIERPGGEVHEIGRRQSQVDHVEPLMLHPFGERARQLDATRAHVAGHQDPARNVLSAPGAFAAGPLGPRARRVARPQGAIGMVEHEAAECGADLFAECGVDLVGDDPPDVVGLEDAVQIGHAAPQASTASGHVL
jgi:hypothetical protein